MIYEIVNGDAYCKASIDDRRTNLVMLEQVLSSLFSFEIDL